VKRPVIKSTLLTVAASAAVWSGVKTEPLRAETEIGNGGDAIVCVDGSTITAEVYDAYEARELLGMPADFGPDDTDPVTMARFAVERLARLDPVRHGRFTAMVNRFMQEARIIDRANLRDIPDTDPSVVPHHCSLRQLAIQYRNPAPRMPRYLIDKSLWDRLDNQNKAYLILHEVIYFETIGRGATDSKTARYFNAHLASEFFNGIDQTDFDDLVKDDLKLPTLAEVDGLTVLKDSMVRDQNGTLLMAVLSGSEYWTSDMDSRTWARDDRQIILDHGSTVYFADGQRLWKGQGQALTVRNRREYSRVPAVTNLHDFTWQFPSRGEHFELAADGTIKFIASTFGFGAVIGDTSGCYALIKTNNQIPLVLDPSGMPRGRVSDYSSARIGSDFECATGNYRHFWFNSGEAYEFYPNGHLKEAVTFHRVMMFNQAGDELEVLSGTRVKLDENGRLIQ
jgi:hypothetical protein